MLELNKICFTKDNKRILNNVDLTINEGEFVAITGPNGSGKSTLAQIIMGMPFYTRLWQEKTENGEVKISSETKSMYAAETELSRYGVTAMWDETTKQYYAEYEQGGSVYKMWLEEEDSLREKLSRISEAKLAGTALWRLELEKDEVWDVIREYAK